MKQTLPLGVVAGLSACILSAHVSIADLVFEAPFDAELNGWDENGAMVTGTAVGSAKVGNGILGAEVAGVFGELDGSSYVNYSGGIPVSNTVRTTSIWVKTTYTDADQVALAFGTTGNGKRWELGVTYANNKGRLMLDVGGGGKIHTTIPNGKNESDALDITDGEWHLLTAVLPNSWNSVYDTRLYIDGVLYDHTSPATNWPIQTVGSIFRVGAGVDVDGSGEPLLKFKGYLRSAAIWDDEALSDEQIANVPGVYTQPHAIIPASAHYYCRVTPVDDSGMQTGPLLNSFVYETTAEPTMQDLKEWTASYTNFEMQEAELVDTDLEYEARRYFIRLVKPVQVDVTLLQTAAGNWLPSECFDANGDLKLEKVEIKPRAIAADVIKDYANGGISVSGKTISFVLKKPANLYVEVGGYPNVPHDLSEFGINGVHHSMCVFANPPLVGNDVPDSSQVVYVEPDANPDLNGSGSAVPELENAQSGDIIYFKPGVHVINTKSPFKTGVKYYIPGGAFVRGTFDRRNDDDAHQSDDVKFWGYGVMSGRGLTGTMMMIGGEDNTNNNKNFELKGITFEDTPFHVLNVGNAGAGPTGPMELTRNLPNRFLNYKTLNWMPSTDAFGGHGNFLVEGCFLRCQDDCVYLNQGNGVFRRTTLWNDYNATAFLFTPGPGGGDTTVEDCDVIYNNSYINNGKLGNLFAIRGFNDNATLDNVHLKNVRVGAYSKHLFKLRLDHLKSRNAGDYPNNAEVRDISFKNIVIDNYLATFNGLNTSGVHGCPENPNLVKNVHDITFEDIHFAGDIAERADFDIDDAHTERIAVEEVSTGPDLPVGWLNKAIGNVSSGAGADYDDLGEVLYPEKNTKGIFSVTGSGNVWGNSDNFEIAYKRVEMVNNKTQVIAGVAYYSGGKAGIMLRETLGPGSPHISCFINGNQINVVARKVAGNPTQQSYSKTLASVPSGITELQLIRNGTSYTAKYKLAGDTDWTDLPVVVEIPELNSPRLYFGLVSCSEGSSLKTTAFSGVQTIPTMMEF